MFGLGPIEIAAIAVLGLLLFGRKLPSVMKNLGKSAKELKKGFEEGANEEEKPKEIKTESKEEDVIERHDA